MECCVWIILYLLKQAMVQVLSIWSNLLTNNLASGFFRFLKDQILVSFILFIYVLIFIISFFLHILCFVCSCLSNFLKQNLRLFCFGSVGWKLYSCLILEFINRFIIFFIFSHFHCFKYFWLSIVIFLILHFLKICLIYNCLGVSQILFCWF